MMTKNAKTELVYEISNLMGLIFNEGEHFTLDMTKKSSRFSPDDNMIYFGLDVILENDIYILLRIISHEIRHFLQRKYNTVQVNRKNYGIINRKIREGDIPGWQIYQFSIEIDSDLFAHVLIRYYCLVNKTLEFETYDEPFKIDSDRIEKHPLLHKCIQDCIDYKYPHYVKSHDELFHENVDMFQKFHRLKDR